MLIIFVALVAAMLAGCGRRAAPSQVAPSPEPAAAPAGPVRVFPQPAESATPAPQPIATPAPTALAQRLRAAEEADERGEIVGELWELATPEAVEILRQRFFIEPDVDVKTDIVAGLIDEQKPETRELRFGILAAAVAPTQPVEVREAAVAMLVEFDDVRAVSLLQGLLQDASEEVREAAKEALAERQER